MTDTAPPWRRRTPVPQWPRLPSTGVVLGVDDRGAPVAFPLLVPGGATRVGVVGRDLDLAALVACRLIGQGCELTVVSDRPGPWRRIAAQAPTPTVVADRVGAWPPIGRPCLPALIVDVPATPPAEVSTPWSTVVHVSPRFVPDSPWWRSADLVLASGPQAADVLAASEPVGCVPQPRPPDDAVVAFGGGRVEVLQPVLDDLDRRLLVALGSG